MSGRRRWRAGLLAAAVLLRFAAMPLEAQDSFAPLRRQMVSEQIERRGVTAPGVLAAMSQVPEGVERDFVADEMHRVVGHHRGHYARVRTAEPVAAEVAKYPVKIG